MLERVTPDHLPMIQEWCKLRGMSEFPDGWLPPTGFVFAKIAAAFLYKTDSSVAYMECVITNPDTTKTERYMALDQVTEAICEEAKAQGFRFLLGWSDNSSLIGHAKALGFSVIGPDCKVLFRRL